MNFHSWKESLNTKCLHQIRKEQLLLRQQQQQQQQQQELNKIEKKQLSQYPKQPQFFSKPISKHNSKKPTMNSRREIKQPASYRR